MLLCDELCVADWMGNLIVWPEARPASEESGWFVLCQTGEQVVSLTTSSVMRLLDLC